MQMKKDLLGMVKCAQTVKQKLTRRLSKNRVVLRSIIYGTAVGALSYLLVACNTVSINPELKPYYDSYVDLAPKGCLRSKGIHIDFSSSIESPTAAYCLKLKPFGYFIKVRPSFWAEATELERTHTIWHELSHCELGLGHVQNSKHYMYYAVEFISYKNLIKQTKDDIDAFCK